MGEQNNIEIDADVTPIIVESRWAHWRNHHLHAMLAVLAASLVFVAASGVFVIYSIGQQGRLDDANRTIKRLEAKNKSLAALNADLEDDNETCRDAVETAWGAWDRRNALTVRVLETILSGIDISEEIEEDNSLFRLDFYSTESCVEIDEESFFESANG